MTYDMNDIKKAFKKDNIQYPSCLILGNTDDDKGIDFQGSEMQEMKGDMATNDDLDRTNQYIVRLENKMDANYKIL